MAFTGLIPAEGAVDRALAAAEEALARARAAAGAAGPGARCFTRVSFTVQSREALDALAHAWGTTPRWAAGETQYVTESRTESAEIEAVWIRQAAAEGSEAAA